MKKSFACGGVLSVLMGLLLWWGLGDASGGEANEKAAQVLAKITLTPEMAKASGLEVTPGNPPIRLSATGPLEARTCSIFFAISALSLMSMKCEENDEDRICRKILKNKH